MTTARHSATTARACAALAIVALVLVTAAAYWNVLGHQFLHFDDPEYVTDNTIVMNGLTWEGARWAFTTTYFSNWHPLTWLSHMIDVELFGPGPRGHHGVNLLFHVANALLLLGVLYRLTGTFWTSYVVAAWFALHPLHVESVAWIAERKDVLSTFFGLLALGAYTAYTKKTTWVRYAWVVLWFVLALMSKPMVVTLPCVMVLLDFWPLDRMRDNAGQLHWKRLGRVAVEKLPLVALSAASAIVTYMAQAGGGAVGSLERFGLGVRTTNAVVAYGHYLRTTLWPAGLAILYPHPRHALPVTIVGAALVALGAITFVALWQARRRPFLLVGWLWFLGTLVPVIGLVQVGEQAYADRYMYLPIVGLFIMAVWGVRSVLPAARMPAAFAFAIVTALVWAGATRAQARHWRDSAHVFTRALAVTEDNYVAHTSLGAALLRDGKIDLAYEHFQKAHAINPTYPEALNNLGYVFLKRNDPAKALEFLQEAVRLYPEYVEAQVNLGIALASVARYDESIRHLEYAVNRRPDYPGAWFNLGMAHVAQKDYVAAATAFRTVVDQSPHDVQARRLLGISLLQSGKTREAAAEFRKVLEEQPGDREAGAYLNQIEVAGGS